jgi:hypothetical protein
VKTVEEVIAILQTLPPKSRILVGDDREGTIRDIGSIRLYEGHHYDDKRKNGVPVVELEVDMTDEWHESWAAEHGGKDLRITRKPKKSSKPVEVIPKEIRFYTDKKTPTPVKQVYEFMKQVGYILIGSDVNNQRDQRWYKKDKKEISICYYFKLQDADFMEEPVYRWTLASPMIASPGSCWLLDEDPIPYLKRIVAVEGKILPRLPLRQRRGLNK